MIQETIQKIEDRIKNTASLDDSKKAELLKLVSHLKGEVVNLSCTQNEQAESITRFAHLSAHEATRQTQNPKLLKLSVDGLKTSVKEFEVTHPKLVELVNSICTRLSSLGL